MGPRNLMWMDILSNLLTFYAWGRIKVKIFKSFGMFIIKNILYTYIYLLKSQKAFAFL